MSAWTARRTPSSGTKLLQYLAGERGARRLDPEHHAQLDRWRRASVEAARDGRELPERPPTPVSGTAGATGASTPLTGGLPPMLSTDRGEDFEVEVVESANERWGGLTDGDELCSLAEAIARAGDPAERAWLQAHLALLPEAELIAGAQAGALAAAQLAAALGD
jgi:hypothetical protein